MSKPGGADVEGILSLWHRCKGPRRVIQLVGGGCTTKRVATGLLRLPVTTNKRSARRGFFSCGFRCERRRGQPGTVLATKHPFRTSVLPALYVVIAAAISQMRRLQPRSCRCRPWNPARSAFQCLLAGSVSRPFTTVIVKLDGYAFEWWTLLRAGTPLASS